MTSELKNVRSMTAADAYACRALEVQALLLEVEKKFKAAAQSTNHTDIHWGHVGDMTRLAEQLQAILS